MKLITIINCRFITRRMFRATCLLIAGMYTIIQPGMAQTAGKIVSDQHYRYLSTLNSGPSYNYDITTFVVNYLPVNAINYSDDNAISLNAEAINLFLSSNDYAARAKTVRGMHKNLSAIAEIRANVRKADSLDFLADNAQLDATIAAINACKSQYGFNLHQISGWQKESAYPNDELTTAGLLTREAEMYYGRALDEVEVANTQTSNYQKLGYMEAAHKHLFTALLKQQCAENIYLSLQRNSSTEIALKIDSLLTPSPRYLDAPGIIVFSVQVGAYKGQIPADDARKLLKIKGLGITQHKAINGFTLYTVGAYSSFTCADLLSSELHRDGFGSSAVVSFTGSGSDAKPFEGIALK